MPTPQRIVSRLVGIAWILLKHPTQARFVPSWLRSFRSSTIRQGVPWLPYTVLEQLAKLPATATVFEYGGGGSTVWLTRRFQHVVTAEHDQDWADEIAGAVERSGLTNCTLVRRSADNDYADYVVAIDDYPDEHFDAVVVDGRERVRCFEHSMPKVKRGGILVLDDAERERYDATTRLATGWPTSWFEGLTPTKKVAGYTRVWVKP